MFLLKKRLSCLEVRFPKFQCFWNLNLQTWQIMSTFLFLASLWRPSVSGKNFIVICFVVPQILGGISTTYSTPRTIWLSEKADAINGYLLLYFWCLLWKTSQIQIGLFYFIMLFWYLKYIVSFLRTSANANCDLPQILDWIASWDLFLKSTKLKIQF